MHSSNQTEHSRRLTSRNRNNSLAQHTTALEFHVPCTQYILVNDQLDAQFFSMYLFQFSTCFEQLRAHHQEKQLYQYLISYMSLFVGDRLVCRSERNLPTCTRNGHLHRVTYTRCCIDTIDSPDDEHRVARNM
jgi:hypothetical protein